jgi:hypothetical protein
MATETKTDTKSRGEATDSNVPLRYGSSIMALAFAALIAFGIVLTGRVLAAKASSNPAWTAARRRTN